jgi:hypothetical protein
MINLSNKKKKLKLQIFTIIITSLALAGCSSNNQTPAPVPSKNASEKEVDCSVFDPNCEPIKVSDEQSSVIKDQMNTGSVQNDPRTGEPVPEKLITFMKFLNETNIYVVEAEISELSELTAAYKRVWDWAAAAGLGLYAGLTSEELEAGIDPTDPTPATILGIVTLDGTNYCAIDIRYLGEKVEPSHLIQQSLLTMPCADLATEIKD